MVALHGSSAASSRGPSHRQKVDCRQATHAESGRRITSLARERRRGRSAALAGGAATRLEALTRVAVARTAVAETAGSTAVADTATGATEDVAAAAVADTATGASEDVAAAAVAAAAATRVSIYTYSCTPGPHFGGDRFAVLAHSVAQKIQRFSRSRQVVSSPSLAVLHLST